MTAPRRLQPAVFLQSVAKRLLMGTLPALFCSTAAWSQDTGWATEARGQISFVQAGFHNWQEGGTNSFALTTGLNAKAERASPPFNQEHSIRLGFGLVKQNSLPVRKAEDIIDIQGALAITGGGFFAVMKPTLATRIRSQFAYGYDYDRESPDRVSAFLAPGSFQQAAGFSFGINGKLRQRIGVSAKETIVAMQSLRARYRVEPDRAMRLEYGLESYTEFETGIAQNVELTSKLHMFAAVGQQGKPDALLETLISMKVNRWLQVNFEHVALYDADVLRAIQMKEVLSVGIAVRLL